MILADNETKVDLLNNEAIAKTVIGLLEERPDQPVTIGIHGDWGAGKSSILEMIEAGLDGKNETLCLKFNGWRFQGFEDAKIALIEGIVTGLVEKRPALQKAADAVKSVFKRIDWLKVAKRAGGLAMTAFTGIPSIDQLKTVLGSLENALSNPTTLLTKENITNVAGELKAVLQPATESKNVPEEVEEFRKAFDQLLNDAGIKQLVVLIDDLDRCLPDTAIETLEAIRLFVFTSRTAFVVAADEAMIEYAVRKHFPDLPDTTGPRDYARNYLEKLIQIPFRIPALGETETRIYVTLLLIGAQLEANDAEYLKLIGVAREKFQRPWTGVGLDAATVKSILTKNIDKANNALVLSDQLGPLLASGSNGNPRQIKRFLNSLLLRERTAIARGFGADIQLPVLAKLMLAERFIPRLFEQIAYVAAVDSKGLCSDLESLERALSQPDTKLSKGVQSKEQKASQSATTAESDVVTDWIGNKNIRDWALLTPKLSGIDLRPYLFVTKDKKNYFGPVSVLGHLATVVEKLFVGKFTVQSYESELRALASQEAETVFEAVRGRIMSAGIFNNRPLGVDGLIVLVKAQPSLQSQLVDFLEAIPQDKCGPWVISGWQAAIKDEPATGRLKNLIEKWSKATNNDPLKITAELALKDLSKGK